MTCAIDPHGPLATPAGLRVDAFVPGNVLGTGNPRPHLSWILPTAPTGWVQESYEVETALVGADGFPHSPALTHRIEGADSVLVPWPAAPLTSRERVQIRVRVHGRATGNDGHLTSQWSEPVTVEAGLLQASDWQALPVGAPWPENPTSDRRPPRVRRDFEVPVVEQDSSVVSARLYLSAQGLVRAHINGVRVGKDELVPGWTVYDKRLTYRTYDVTDLVTPGMNAIGCELADGWFRGHIGFDGGYHNLWGEHCAAIAQLEITQANGTRTIVATDGDWQAGAGPILFTGLYEGENYDARLEDPIWATAGGPALVDQGAPQPHPVPTHTVPPQPPALPWLPVRTYPSCAHLMVAPTDEAVGCVEEIAPVDVRRIVDPPSPFPFHPDAPKAPQRHIVDFGQNASGRLRIRVSGRRGDLVRLRHAEVLDSNGELATRPLRAAHATDTYVLRGDEGGEVWEPAFTIHGFRYAEITGPKEIRAEDVTMRVIHTRMSQLGEFECSNAEVTRLHLNSLWSMKSNFVSIPMDCPQRDERLGWTGDIQAFAPTALFHHDCRGLLRGWLADLWEEQQRYGTVPWYVPVIPGGFWSPPRPAAVWGDAATVVPWEIHQATGDVQVLHDQWDSAAAWVDLVEDLAGPGRLWLGDLQLGDWLDPVSPPENPFVSQTEADLVANAFFARSTRILSAWASIIGRAEQAEHYGTLAEEITTAWRSRWVVEGDRLSSHSQAAYALAIAFDMDSGPDQRAAWGCHLASLVEASGGHVATGFAGTPVLCSALSATGHDEEAYRLLLTRTVPSWLYAVSMGATTTWERWDSMLPDGSVNPGDMTSFNHYALGAVDAWLVRDVAGLSAAQPGYRRIRIAPKPGGGLDFARVCHATPYGQASVSWRIEEGKFHLEAVVPVGTVAEVTLPFSDEVIEVAHGQHRFTVNLPA